MALLPAFQQWIKNARNVSAGLLHTMNKVSIHYVIKVRRQLLQGTLMYADHDMTSSLNVSRDTLAKMAPSNKEPQQVL